MAEKKQVTEKVQSPHIRLTEGYETQNKHSEIAELPADDFFDFLESSSLDELEEYIQTTKTETPVNYEGSMAIKDSSFSQDASKDIVSTILWWELRRPLFNLIIGLCGLITLIALSILNNAPPAYLVFGSLGYFLTINAVYTFAWLFEVIVQMILGRKEKSIGPKLFKLGTTFSVMLTLSIAILLPLMLLISRPFG